ncbi:MAG: YggS family pyridoxal phosphate-dependent enzyme [Longicatena sp.]
MDKKVLAEIKNELPKNVQLIAVSKTHSKKEIDEAFLCGCTIFGENKVQELQEKYDKNYQWHMIGHLQRNKVKDVVPLVDMIESVDSLRLAEEIEKQCNKIDKIMPILIEVNISRETNKTGVLLEECPSFVKQCKSLPHLDVQGLMCVGPLCDDHELEAACFEKMNILFHKLQNEYGSDTFKYLSMGMSSDYKLAIQHGSNMIRLGTIIFGKRDYK